MDTTWEKCNAKTNNNVVTKKNVWIQVTNSTLNFFVRHKLIYNLNKNVNINTTGCTLSKMDSGNLK